MTYKDDLYFSYAGKLSTDFKLINVSLSNGLYEETFLSTRTIIEEKVQGRSKPYFMGVDHEPYQFQVSFAFEEKWDKEKIGKIVRWLKQKTYQPFYFSNDMNRIFYCIVIDDTQIIHNGLKEGYLNITFRCDSEYSYSPVYSTQVYDFSNNVSGGNVTFINNGHENCLPDVFIEKIGAGDISIVNLSDSGREFKFTGLSDLEVITVDNENEIIETDLSNIYRYNNFNNTFLTFPVGYNYLKIYGSCKLQFKYRLKLLA